MITFYVGITRLDVIAPLSPMDNPKKCGLRISDPVVLSQDRTLWFIISCSETLVIGEAG